MVCQWCKTGDLPSIQCKNQVFFKVLFFFVSLFSSSSLFMKIQMMGGKITEKIGGRGCCYLVSVYWNCLVGSCSVMSFVVEYPSAFVVVLSEIIVKSLYVSMFFLIKVAWFQNFIFRLNVVVPVLLFSCWKEYQYFEFTSNNGLVWIHKKKTLCVCFTLYYSIVKDSNADLTVGNWNLT